MLQGRYAVITGADQGLGTEIARHFVSAGASVMLCARGADILWAIRADLSANLRIGQQVLVQAADVADEADVASLFRATFDSFPQLDILVSNAGDSAPIGRMEEIDPGSWTKALRSNLFGTMNCCRAALPAMRRARHGKIINVTSPAAAVPMPHFSACVPANAAVIRLTETLALEAADDGIDINAVAPGPLEMPPLDEVGLMGAGRTGAARSGRVEDQAGSPLVVGAELCVFLASEKSNGITGKLVSAAGDRWRDWPKHLQEIQRSDVYTLRRITGRERGMPWGDV